MSASQTDEVAGVRPILKRMLANAGMLLSGRAVNAVLGLAYMALAARGLGARDVGVLVLIQAFAQFLGEVVKFQSWQTILNYGARPLAEGRKAQFQRVLRFTLVIDAASTVLGIVIGVAGSLIFANLLGWGAHEAPAAALYMVTIAFAVSAVPMGLLRLFDRFDVLSHEIAVMAVLRVIAGGVAYMMHAPMEGFLLAWALGTVGGFIYLVWQSTRELRKRDLLAGFSWRGPLTEGMPGVWSFAWNTNLTATLDVAFTHVATLIVGAIAGPTQAAYWRVGRQVADAIAKPAKLMTPVLYPELARLRAGDQHEVMWRLVKQVGMLAGGAGIILLTVSVLAGRPLLTLAMGQSFAPAAEVMTWQVGAAVIGVFALPLEPMLISLGNPGAAVRVRLIVSAGFLVALPWLVHTYGLIGAGAGLAAVASGLALGMLLFILRENGNRRAPAAAAAPATNDRLKGEA